LIDFFSKVILLPISFIPCSTGANDMSGGEVGRDTILEIPIVVTNESLRYSHPLA
jgi:hypothetical protein